MNPYAELSSLATTLDDLTTRLGEIAERCDSDGKGQLAVELFEIERALNGGRRRLSKVVNS